MESPARVQRLQVPSVEDEVKSTTSPSKMIMSPTKAQSSILKNFKTSSGSAKAAFPCVIVRQSNSSIAYVVEFTEAVKVAPRRLSTQSWNVADDESAHYLSTKLQSRMLRASFRRTAILQERQLRLRRRAESIKYKTMLLRQRQRLYALKLRAKSDYALTAASLKRHLFLKERVDRVSAAIEHAQTVAMVHRLKKYMTLKKSMSENFKDLLAAAEELAGPSFGVETSQSVTEEEYESEDIVVSQLKRAQSLPAVFESLDEYEYIELGDLLPPITRFTLRELDLDEIISNAQLRHDLYFDPNLQFKPNTDGERGAAKLSKANAYWEKIHQELSVGNTERVPLLIFEVKHILLELLPYSETLREELDAKLDITLIAQQIEHGIFNSVTLIQYIAGLLKQNCAPARDQNVDSVVELAQKGDFAQCLRVLFEVLELMKLDYANHQLHRLRPYVIENARSFEFNWFKSQVESESVKLDDTAAFLREARYKAPANASFTEVFNESLVNLIMSAHTLSTLPVPETLRMDITRLISYYNDIQDVTIMSALLLQFRSAAAGKATDAQMTRMKDVLWVLLNDAETSIWHIVLEISKVAGEARGRPFTEEEMKFLNGVIEKTLVPENPLFDLLRVRVGRQIVDFLANGELNQENMIKHGLSYMEAELKEVAQKVQTLADHNKDVYGPFYNALIIASDDQDGSNEPKLDLAKILANVQEI